MYIVDYYRIEKQFMYMFRVNDRYGYEQTLVYETNKYFFVNRTPEEILDDSIRCNGFDLKGALETSKRLLKKDKMSPIVVDNREGIIVFPSKSIHHKDNMWFNIQHTMVALNHKGHTQLSLSNGSSLILPQRVSSINNRMQSAEQLKKIVMDSPHMALVLLTLFNNEDKKKK